MFQDWYNQAPVLTVILGMFWFIVHSVGLALIAYWMHRDGRNRNIRSINWWVGIYVVLGFLLGTPLLGLPPAVLLIIYFIYRANFSPGRSESSQSELETPRKTVIMKRFDASPIAHLMILGSPSGLDINQRLPLRAGTTTSLGASRENDLAFPLDPTMSRTHAAIRETSDGGVRSWQLVDQGSSNGTQVWTPALNQWEPISKPIALRNGDRFICGGTQLQLVTF